MAAVPVEIRGTLYDLASKSTRQVYLVGEAVRSDVGVGGGPMPGGDLGFWGGYRPPYVDAGPPGQQPDGIWGGYRPPYVDAGLPMPQPPDPPIDVVPPGTPPDEVVKAAPPGGWGYYTDSAGAPYAAYRPAADQAGPKA